MFRFTIRELVLLTVIVAMGVAWLVDHARLAPAAADSVRNLQWKDLAALSNRHLSGVLNRVATDWQDRYPLGSLPLTEPGAVESQSPMP